MIIEEGKITTQPTDLCSDCTYEYCCFILSTIRDSIHQLGDRCEIAITKCKDYIAERRNDE